MSWTSFLFHFFSFQHFSCCGAKTIFNDEGNGRRWKRNTDGCSSGLITFFASIHDWFFIHSTIFHFKSYIYGCYWENKVETIVSNISSKWMNCIVESDLILRLPLQKVSKRELSWQSTWYTFSHFFLNTLIYSLNIVTLHTRQRQDTTYYFWKLSLYFYTNLNDLSATSLIHAFPSHPLFFFLPLSLSLICHRTKCTLPTGRCSWHLKQFTFSIFLGCNF